MDKLLLGLILILLDCRISFGSVSIDLMPDFLGHFFIAQGCFQFISYHRHFAKTQIAAKILTGYTGIHFLLDLLGISTRLGLLTLLLNGISMICSLIAVYWLICGIRQIEQQRTWDLASAPLQTMWAVMACLHSLSLVLSWIPILGTLASLASVIVSICFLAAFHKSRRLFAENLRKQNHTIDAESM